MVQLVVNYFNGQIGYYLIHGSVWRLDNASRQIIVGRGIPRKFIPLDNVACYDIEEVDDARNT